MTSQLDIIEGYLYNKGVGYVRLDGSTSREDREEMLQLFNKVDNETTKVFLLSTRAGAVGINLQAADTVILYDR